MIIYLCSLRTTKRAQDAHAHKTKNTTHLHQQRKQLRQRPLLGSLVQGAIQACRLCALHQELWLACGQRPEEFRDTCVRRQTLQMGGMILA